MKRREKDFEKSSREKEGDGRRAGGYEMKKWRNNLQKPSRGFKDR